MRHFKPYLVAVLLAVLGFCNCRTAVGQSNLKIIHKSNKATKGTKPAAIAFPMVDSLKTLFAIADTIKHTYGENDTTDHVGEIIDAISTTLHTILSDTVITKQNLDSVLNIHGLGIVHSNDKRLWLFTWYENTGGSFQSNRTIVYYKNQKGKPIIADDEEGPVAENLFSSAGASFYAIYKLRSKKHDLYLCIGSGIGCSSCVFNTATVVELRKDSANFGYDAFDAPSDDVITYGDNNQSCLTFGARNGDIEKFQFNAKTQTLTIVYLTDDNTPIQWAEDDKQERIVRRLVFNGRKFVGDVFH